MPAKRRTHAVRITALALAGAVNALFLSLWLVSRTTVPPEAVVAAMIWIAAPLPDRALPKARQDPRPHMPTPPRPPRTPPPIPAPAVPAPESGTAITLPPVDWNAEGIRSARELFRDQVPQERPPSLDSKPQVLALPDKSNLPHKAGDTEHFEGGEVITWINELCYYSNRPGPIGFGGASRKVCKVRSLAQRRSEAQAAELEKAITPHYLHPLPLPQEDTPMLLQ